VSYNIIIFVPNAGTLPHEIVLLHFNFLAVVVSEIFGGSQVYIRTSPSGKILTHPQVLAYTYMYITVKFQLRIASLMCDLRRALSITGFALKGPQNGVSGDFGGRGENIWLKSTSVLRISRFQTSLVQI